MAAAAVASTGSNYRPTQSVLEALQVYYGQIDRMTLAIPSTERLIARLETIYATTPPNEVEAALQETVQHYLTAQKVSVTAYSTLVLLGNVLSQAGSITPDVQAIIGEFEPTCKELSAKCQRLQTAFETALGKVPLQVVQTGYVFNSYAPRPTLEQFLAAHTPDQFNPLEAPLYGSSKNISPTVLATFSQAGLVLETPHSRVDRLQTQLASLEKELKEANAQLDYAESAFGNALFEGVGRESELTEKLRGIEGRVAEKERELQQALTSIRRLEHDKSAAVGRAKDSSATVDRLNEEVRRLTASLERAEDLAARHLVDSTAATARATTASEKLLELDQRVQKLTEERDGALKEVARLRNELSGATAVAAGLRNQIRELKNPVSAKK